MAQIANDVVGVVLGEAKAKSYNDMLHVASVIANRARSLGISMEDVVRNAKEFNAYGKALPPGVSKYKDLAQKAITQVMTKGPVTTAQFYATPSAAKNLPSGLQKVAATTGHQYFVDPQNRAINTALGYRKPDPSLGLMNLAPSMVPDGTLKTTMADPRMDPRLGGVISSLSNAGFGGVTTMSGFRTPEENRAVRGAPKSQHLGGKAIDVRGLGLTDDQKADMLDRALMSGVRGVGLYSGPKQGIHLDVRDKGQFWSGGYYGLTADQAPSWAKDQIGQLLSLDKTNTYLPSRPINTPIPTPRAAMTMMAKAQPTPSKAAVKAGYQQYANSRRTPQDALVANAPPTTRQVERAAATRGFNPGGILTGQAAVSLSPVSNAQAAGRVGPRSVSLPPDRQMPSGKVTSGKTSKGMSYSLAPAPRDVVAVDRKMSYPPSAPMSVGKYSPSKPSQVSFTGKAVGGIAPSSTAAAYAQMARPSPVASPAAVKAGYQQYGMLRSTTPVSATVRSMPSAPVSAIQQVSRPSISVKATAGTMVPGPLTSPSIAAPQVAATQKQNMLQRAITPQNLSKVGGAVIGNVVAGPVGGIVGGLLGSALAGKQKSGQSGLLGALGNALGGQGPMSINNIGGGLAAVSAAMGGPRGMQANYTSPAGGGQVTSLGNGSYQRTSNKYGWTEVTDSSGRTSASGNGGIFGGLFDGMFGGSKSKSDSKKK